MNRYIGPLYANTHTHTHTSTDLVVLCHARSDVTALKYGAKCNPILKQIENFTEVISL